MKVTLQSLTLCNFKGEKERTTLFHPETTTIMGGNGLGKSRHFDAFLWLLFGKDAAGRKDYEIKTRINGEELHNVECSVTGVLDVDGQQITIKRALVEKWVKPRGQMEQVYKGNDTECWWNEAPVKVTEYAKRIESIISPDAFKMITNPAHFASMDWKKQREQLFNLAGNVSDEEIANIKAEFADLLAALNGKPMADYKAELNAKKKRLNEELAQVQPRIDQTHKMMPDPVDTNALEAQLAGIDKQLADIDEIIASASAATRKAYEAEQAKQAEINDLEKQKTAIVFEHHAQVDKETYEGNAKHRECEALLVATRSNIETERRTLSMKRVEIARIHNDIRAIEAKQDELRKQWFAENAKEYNGETTCPHCGQPLPADKIEQAKAIFAKHKAEILADITGRGQEFGKQVEALKQNEATVQTEIDKAETALNHDLETEKMQNEALEATPERVAQYLADSCIDGVAAINRKIEEIRATLSTDATPNVDTAEQQETKRTLMAQRDTINKQLATVGERAKFEQEIERIKEHGKQVAEQIAEIEKTEFTMQNFTKAKIEECEKRINGLFKVVTWRLFDYTIDGNPIETCVPLINGVPYGSANTASRVNAGLDIVNALCKFYDVNAPIFIDGRESVNELIPTESQVINLVVNQDNFITVK